MRVQGSGGMTRGPGCSRRLRMLVAACTLLSITSIAQAQPGTGTGTGAQKLPDPFPSTYQPMPRADTLIEHATILDGAGHRLEDTDLLLRDGKVNAVGKGLVVPAGARTIDAKGRWI